MATSAGNGDNESDSLTQESDAVEEMFCEHCEKDIGSIVGADCFCVECSEYFCSTCLRYHNRYKPDHKIQDRANMPQDFYFKKCKDHSKELIKFYCKSCTKTACSICKTNKHSQCVTEHISIIVGSTDLKSELSSMVKSIDNNLTVITDSRNVLSSNLSEFKAVSQNAIASVRDHRIKLERSVEALYKDNVYELDKKQKQELKSFEKKKADLLAKLDKEKEELNKKHQHENKKLQHDKKHVFEVIGTKEKKIVKEGEQMKQKDEIKLKSLSSKADQIEAELKTTKQSILRQVQRNKKCETFLAIKEAERQMENMKMNVEEVSNCRGINYYDFQSSNDIISKQNTSISFGSFIEMSKIERSIKHLQDISTKHNADKKLSSITGLCKISDGHLIAADNANASIKVIDTERKLVSAEVKLEDKPFATTHVENNTFAVTLPDVKKIQLLSVTKNNQMSLHSQITVQRNCYGITFKKPNMIIGCSGKVQVLSLDGKVLNTVAELGSIPKHLMFHPNGNELYVQGNWSTDDHVLKVSMAGNNTVTKVSQIPYSPSFGNLAVGKTGTIYTCSRDSTSIIQLSAELQKNASYK